MPPASVAQATFDAERQAPPAAPAPSRPLDLARVCDRALNAGVVAFAAWTVVYDVCLVLRIGAVWAAVAWAASLAGCAWLARRTRAAADRPWPSGRLRRRLRLPRWVLATNLVAAVAAAGLFALTGVRWGLVWVLWLAAAATAVAWCATRPDLRAATAVARVGRAEVAVVAAWALGLALLTLVLMNPDSDDAYYVHLSTWTAAHGSFPLRDVLFGDQVLPALYYPPASSWEALLGTLGRVTTLSVPDIVYVAVPPVAAVLAVLATWRLLRAWRVPRAWLALSVASAFLVLGAVTMRAFGVFALTRVWQGKALLVTVLVPLLFALAHEYAERPTRRALALLACAGVAAVGLSTSAIFIVPVVALGCFAAVALRSLPVALRGFTATAAYPLAVGLVSLAMGGRAPDKAYTASQLQPQNLLHLLLGANLTTVLAVAAILAAPVLLPQARAGAMVAGTALVAGLMLAPRVSEALFAHIGLGRELSRLIWAVPVAALIGALATTVAADRGRLLRYVPAVVAIAVLVLAGRPVWSHAVGSDLTRHPGLKRWPGTVAQSRQIMALSRPGDVVLAPRPVSETLLVMSGDVTAVGTRPMYVRPLYHVPGARARARLWLMYLVGPHPVPQHGRARYVREIRWALQVVGVDLACTAPDQRLAHDVLRAAGFSRPVPVGGLSCMRPA
jgi:Family of unknown function (DUF6077)